MDSEIKYKITLTDLASGKLMELERSFKQIDGQVDKARKGLGSLKDTVLGMAGGFGVANIAGTLISGLKDIGGQTLEITGKFQKYNAVLANTLGSQRAATKELSMLKEVAATTPFEFSQLTESFIKMANRGIVPAKEQLVGMGDLAAATGKNFDQLTEALLDASMGEFERLKEFGIKAKLLGNGMGEISFRGMTQQFRKGDQQQMMEIMDTFGKMQGVAGGMAAVMGTLEGQTSNLKDKWEFLLAGFGGKNEGIMKGTVEALSDMVDFTAKLLDLNHPTTNSIQDEITKFGVLKYEYLDVNTKKERRIELLEKMKAEYPEYFAHLDKEKAGIEDVTKAMDSQQNAMIRKLVLQKSQDKITDLSTERAGLLQKKVEAEVTMREVITQVQTDNRNKEYVRDYLNNPKISALAKFETIKKAVKGEETPITGADFSGVGALYNSDGTGTSNNSIFRGVKYADETFVVYNQKLRENAAALGKATESFHKTEEILRNELGLALKNGTEIAAAVVPPVVKNKPKTETKTSPATENTGYTNTADLIYNVEQTNQFGGAAKGKGGKASATAMGQPAIYEGGGAMGAYNSTQTPAPISGGLNVSVNVKVDMGQNIPNKVGEEVKLEVVKVLRAALADSSLNTFVR